MRRKEDEVKAKEIFDGRLTVLNEQDPTKKLAIMRLLDKFGWKSSSDIDDPEKWSNRDFYVGVNGIPIPNQYWQAAYVAGRKTATFEEFVLEITKPEPPPKPTFIEGIKLSNGQVATVHKSGDMKVGCHQARIEDAVALVEAYKSLQEA